LHKARPAFSGAGFGFHANVVKSKGDPGPYLVTGDSKLIAENGKELRVDEVKGGEKVYSLDQKTGKLVPAKILALLDMGVKPTFRLRTASGKQIETTANHPYLVRTDSLLGASFGENPQEDDGNSQQRPKDVEIGHNGGEVTHSYALLKNALVSQKITESINPEIARVISSVSATSGPTISEAKNTWPMSRDISESASGFASGAIQFHDTAPLNDVNGIWVKVAYLRPGMQIAVAGERLEMMAWDTIVAIEHTGQKQVYDLSIEETHNFIANGIIAHNTYISTDLSLSGGDINLGTGSATSTLSSAGGFMGVGTTTQEASSLSAPPLPTPPS